MFNKLRTRILFGLVSFFSFLVPSLLFAASLSAGIPQDPLWFSKEPFFAGDQITIFAPLYNSSPYRFSGRMDLRDGTTIIGTKQFILLPDGASTVIAFPWKATEGDHIFSLSVTGGQFISSKQDFIDLPISGGNIDVIRRFVHSKQVAPVETSPASPTTGNVATEEAPVIQYLSTKIPTSIAQGTLPILGSVEAFRVAEATRASDMVSALQTTLATEEVSVKNETGWETLLQGVRGGDIIHTPWGYVKLFFALCYGFITTNVYVFYIMLSYILYSIVRLIISAFTI